MTLHMSLVPDPTSCPFDRAAQVLGDRWTILILRDIMLENRRSYRDLLTGSPEGIASKTLTRRLRTMVSDGLLTVWSGVVEIGDSETYALTATAIALVPFMAQLGLAGIAGDPRDTDLRARLLFGGGPRLWARFQEELTAEHVDGIPLARRLVRERLVDTAESCLGGDGPVTLAQPLPSTRALPAPIRALPAPGASDCVTEFVSRRGSAA